MLLYLIRLFNLVTNALAYSFERCGKVWTALEEGLSGREYLFFELNPAPYAELAVNETASGSARAEWVYDADHRIFTEYGAGGGHDKPLPILSLEILYKEKVFYDLTDFAEMIRVRSAEGKLAPCIPHILGAWSLSSGIVLDATRGFEVRLIDMEANTFEVSPFDYSELNDLLESLKRAGAGREATLPVEEVAPSVATPSNAATAGPEAGDIVPEPAVAASSEASDATMTHAPAAEPAGESRDLTEMA
jgi:hypothetical protein